MTYGGQVFEITTVSTNEIVVRYKILYYEIITLITNLEDNMAQIKDAPPSNTTAVMLKVSAWRFLTRFCLDFFLIKFVLIYTCGLLSCTVNKTSLWSMDLSPFTLNLKKFKIGKNITTV